MKRWLAFPFITALLAVGFVAYACMVILEAFVHVGSSLVLRVCAWRDR